MKVDVLVVGAGFAGSVVAEQLAGAGRSVLVVDTRTHIAGNAFDEPDAHGVVVHRYGPHIFHTNAKAIFAYLSRFTEWRTYEHRVRAIVDGRPYPIPINLDTINSLYGLALDEEGAEAYLEKVRERRTPLATSEDVVVNAVGRDLYEKFFRGYTRKQWGLDPSQLSASVAARIPVRTNRDDRYFTDTFQAIPLEGYTAMFQRMLDHEKIEIQLGVDYFDLGARVEATHTVYTGPIDSFFNMRFGPLPYRSLRFEFEHFAGVEKMQDVATVNYPNDFEFTRITEFKHITGQVHMGTTIAREYPQAEGAPYYPVPRRENELLYQRYKDMASREPTVTFVGRLAQYSYYNMDQVVGAALRAAKSLLTARKV